MGPMMRDYLRHFRLAPIQCAVNVFRILGYVDALNEKMWLRLTHHDVNWCYNLQYLKGKTYYMKARDDKVRLIQCLPGSSKGINKDFLIVSRAWHDYLPVRFRNGHQVRHLSKRGLVLDVTVMTFVWLLTGAHFLFFFCKSSRLRTPSSFGQPDGFRDHSSGRGFYERR